MRNAGSRRRDRSVAGFTFHLHRGVASWHDSRSAYLYQRGGPGASLCQTMAKAASEAGLTSTGRPSGSYHGVPWLTSLIGSGCLEIGATDEVTPDQFADAVREAIGALVETEDIQGDVDQSGLVHSFAQELARDRMAGDEAQRPPSGPPAGSQQFTVETRSARVVLIAALLSQIFYLVKARSASPLKRWESDNVLIRNANLIGTEKASLEAVIEVCVHHLDRAGDEFHASSAGSLDPVVCDAVRRLLASIQEQLDRSRSGQVAIANLRLVTEAAWYLMASSTRLYPGWTDLLFKLMLADLNPAQQTARPYIIDQSHVGRRVESLLLDPSQRSWHTWADSRHAGTRREEFYRAVADVLWAQTSARKEVPVTREGDKALPVPSSFVVSFDLELEMALWATAQTGQSFYVLLPVHVQPYENSTDAKMCWLRARFEKDADVGPDDFDALRTPAAWEVVDRDTETPDAPHVVHLSGCPLIKLPNPGAESAEIHRLLAEFLSDSEVRFLADSLRLSHAVTIDEYLALQQAESELIYAVMHLQDRKNGRLALPTSLFSSTTATEIRSSNPRYWMALGVPVSDPAVRSRVITQLTVKNVLSRAGQGESTRIEGSDEFHALVDPEVGMMATDETPSEFDDIFGAGGPRPEGRAPMPDEAGIYNAQNPGRLAGLVVNRRISRDEGGILYWLGLEVVSDFAESFIGDLYHYAAHLGPKHRQHRILLTGSCPIDRRDP